MEYKLIRMSADQRWNKEYDYVAEDFDEAEELAKQLLAEGYEEGYPDTYVQIWDYDEDPDYPFDDGVDVWVRDADGNEFLARQKLGAYCPLYIDYCYYL